MGRYVALRHIGTLGAGWSDPWRMTVNVSGLGITGFEFESQLQDELGIFPELATHKVPPCGPIIVHHVFRCWFVSLGVKLRHYGR